MKIPPALPRLFPHFVRRLLLATMALVCLPSCETVPPVVTTPLWLTTDNGASVWFQKWPRVDRFLWSGALDAEKKAHGFGKLSLHLPETYGDPIFGGGEYENTSTLEGKMVHGRFEGEVIRTESFNGSVQRTQWANGEGVSSEVIRTGVTRTDGGGLLSDSQLVGGLIGLGGIAGGDTGLAGAGLTMLSGDGAGGVAQMADWAGRSPGGGGSSGGGASATRGGTDPNLIDAWSLRGTVKTGQDHMKHYIQAADQAHATYRKSGESGHYQQHRHYAELARDFHQRTGTKTQGYAR